MSKKKFKLRPNEYAMMNVDNFRKRANNWIPMMVDGMPLKNIYEFKIYLFLNKIQKTKEKKTLNIT